MYISQSGTATPQVDGGSTRPRPLEKGLFVEIRVLGTPPATRRAVNDGRRGLRETRPLHDAHDHTAISIRMMRKLSRLRE